MSVFIVFFINAFLKPFCEYSLHFVAVIETFMINLINARSFTFLVSSAYFVVFESVF